MRSFRSVLNRWRKYLRKPLEAWRSLPDHVGWKRLLVTGLPAGLILLLYKRGDLNWLPTVFTKAVVMLAGLLISTSIVLAVSCAVKLIRLLRFGPPEERTGPDVEKRWARIVAVSETVSVNESMLYRVRYCLDGEYRSLTTTNASVISSEGMYFPVYIHRNRGGRWEPDIRELVSRVEEESPASVCAPLSGEERTEPEALDAPAASLSPYSWRWSGDNTEKRPAVSTADSTPPSRSRPTQTVSSPSASQGSAPKPLEYSDYCRFEERSRPRWTQTLIFLGMLLINCLMISSFRSIIVSACLCLSLLPFFLTAFHEQADNLKRRKLYSSPAGVDKVEASFGSVKRAGIAIGNSALVKICCWHEGTGYSQRVFVSDPDRLKAYAGRRVTVYVSREDPELYDIVLETLHY